MQNTYFKSTRDGIDFWLFVAVTFFVGLSRSAQSLLAPILAQDLPPEQVGIVLSASALPMVGAALYASSLIRLSGIYPVALVGIAFMLFGHLSFEVTRGSFAVACLSRAVEGLGSGLFVPASMLFAKYRLGHRSPVYLFGIHSSMILLPIALGPALFEAYLNHYGPKSYFIYTALPFVAALMLSCLVRAKRDQQSASVDARTSRLAMLLRPKTGLLFVLIFNVSVVSGFVNTYMSAYLIEAALPVAFFFTPFSIFLLFSRVLFLRFMEPISGRARIVVSFSLMSAAYYLALFAAGPIETVVAGSMFGLGYSLAYPTLSTWLSGCFPVGEEANRIQAIALFNAVYFAGINVSPFIGGFVIAQASVGFFMAILAGVSGITAVVLSMGLLQGRASTGSTDKARDTNRLDS